MFPLLRRAPSHLWGLQTPTAPFQTALTAAPNDFTIAIGYSGGGFESGFSFQPDGVAIDGAGNVWAPNDYSLSEFGPNGFPLSGANGFMGGGLYGPLSVAVDTSGHVWAANWEGDTLSEFNVSNGDAIGSGYTGAGLASGSYPAGIAIDGSGDVWITDAGGTILNEFDPSGNPISVPDGWSGGGLNSPLGIAFDISGNAWIANNGGNGIVEFNSSGAPTSASGSDGFGGGELGDPSGIALDSSGNVWATTYTNDAWSISELNLSNSTVTNFTGGGLNAPFSIAIDGSSNIWTANSDCACVSEFNSSGTAVSGSNGYVWGVPLYYQNFESASIAVDGSGNVWVSVYAPEGAPPLRQIVGAASPVVTPIAANLKSPYGASAVNKP